MAKLSKEIIEILSKKLGKTENAIRVDISNLRSRMFPGVPLNSVAHIYARQRGKTIWQKLTKDEKAAIPSHEITKASPKLPAKKVMKKESSYKLIQYETTDHFIKGHITEINRTYNHKCYTATFILARKVVENLIIDILIQHYPPTVSQANKELYFDTARGRFKDFGIIIDNLRSKRNDFGLNKSVVERLCDKAKALKDNANDKTHSWFHLVEGKGEIDDLHLESILALIKKLQK